jgi:transposase-like protein
MNCPKCNQTDIVKRGVLRGEQRYYCKNSKCNFHFTESTDLSKTHPDAKPPEARKLAHKLYLKGNGFRDIKDVIEDTFEGVTVSVNTLIKWVKKKP